MIKYKMSIFLSNKLSSVFIHNNKIQLLNKLIVLGLFLFIVSAFISIYVPLLLNINFYWIEQPLLEISRLSLIILVLNYTYIVFAYGVMFVKIFFDERDKFDMEKTND